MKMLTFQKHLSESLHDKEFAKAWEESLPEQLLAQQIIEARTKQNISQRQLARQAQTTQAVISRIETMQANPSISLIRRIAQALHTEFILRVA